MTIKQNGGVFGRNPTFNDVTIEGQLTFDGDIDINSDLKIEGDLVVDTDTLVVDATGNRVGIGTASPNASGSLHVLRSGTSIISSAIANSGAILESGTASVGFNLITPNNQAGYINFGDPEDSNAGRILYSHSSNSMQFGTNDSTIRATITSGGDLSLSSGNLVVASGSGIDFSATSGTGTSELFDDYEEGTFNPTYTTGGTDFDSVTYAVRYGNYVKLGSLIFVTGFIRTSSITVGSASGSVRIGGLPFTRIGSMSPPGICHGGSWAGDVPRTCISFTDATLGLYYRTAANTDDQAIQISDLNAAGNNDLYFACSFRESY